MALRVLIRDFIADLFDVTSEILYFRILAIFRRISLYLTSAILFVVVFGVGLSEVMRKNISKRTLTANIYHTTAMVRLYNSDIRSSEKY